MVVLAKQNYVLLYIHENCNRGRQVCAAVMNIGQKVICLIRLLKTVHVYICFLNYYECCVEDTCSDMYNLHYRLLYFIFYCVRENNLGTLLGLRVGNIAHINCKGYCFQLHTLNFFHEYFVYKFTRPFRLFSSASNY
jgi:hypothetical protein